MGVWLSRNNGRTFVEIVEFFNIKKFLFTKCAIFLPHGFSMHPLFGSSHILREFIAWGPKYVTTQITAAKGIALQRAKMILFYFSCVL